MSRNDANYKQSLESSGIGIYDELSVVDQLYIPTQDLENLLRKGLVGKSLFGLPLRTRSKAGKSLVCEALGYPVPSKFSKTQPRFPGQNLDTYFQKTNNLQIWNEEVAASRRYAVIRLDDNDIITHVRVIMGSQLAQYDNTGTITKKYQARFTNPNGIGAELVSSKDSDALVPLLASEPSAAINISPSNIPVEGCLQPIQQIFEKLKNLIGTRIINPGVSKERSRGVELQKLVCSQLGYSTYEDSGQFPDVFNQVLEVKLQTSPTIDLGLVLPSSEEDLFIGSKSIPYIKHKDARYAVFFGELEGSESVKLTKLVVTTGADFFNRFQRFEGKVINGKIQLRLPNDFFNL